MSSKTQSKNVIVICMTVLLTQGISHADVYFKNSFESNITNCFDTTVNIPRQAQPSNYFIQTEQDFSQPLGHSGYALQNNTYTSLFFIAPELDSNHTNGKLTMIPPGNSQGPGSAGTTISISECRGDFTTHLNQSNCLRIGGGTPSMRWALDTGTIPGATHCLLIPGQVYYLNIIHANNPSNDFSTSTCSSENCGVLFSQNEGN